MKLKIIRIILFALILTITLSILAFALPDEATGIVTNIVDGCTIDVSELGRVQLADIECPAIDTAEGIQARDFTAQWLLDRKIFLDLDNRTDSDQRAHWIAVIYIANSDGSVNTSKNFNRMLLDAGNACILDSSDNEFTPGRWWGGFIPSHICIKSNQQSGIEDSVSSSSIFQLQNTPPNTAPSSKTSLEKAPSPGSSSSGGKFVGSRKSNKYHYASCQWAKKIKPENEIWFSGSQDARNHGYVPCKVCNPP